MNEPKKRGRKPKPKVSSNKKEPKKRGRKPKPKEKNEPKIYKKRGRRKKCDIDSMSKISGFCASGNSIDTIDNNKLKFSNTFVDENKIGENGSKKISFGNFNIGLKTIEESDTSELIKKFHEDTKKNSKCIIEIPEYETESDEDKNTKISSQTFIENFSKKPEKKRKKKKTEKIWKKNSDEFLHLVLDQYRGPDNKKFEWPEKTDIHCWWCCHSFENSPATLPYKYDPIRNRFKVMGIFCSWSCAKSYSLNDNSLQIRNFCMLNLTEFVRQIYGYTIKIPCAPPRQSLKIFGGYMSIKEFRNKDPSVHIRINKTDAVLDPNVYFSCKTE